MLESDILIENVYRIADSHPDRVFASLLFAGQQSIEISYSKLLIRASHYAGLYCDAGVRQNEVVVIVHNDIEQALYAFVGALVYEAVPSIFAHPSVKIAPSEYSKTLRHLLTVCDTRFVMTYPSLFDQLNDHVDHENVKLLLSADTSACTRQTPSRTYSADQIVLLQHSSGTTGLKKGVALSNRSVINQLRNYSVTS